MIRKWLLMWLKIGSAGLAVSTLFVAAAIGPITLQVWLWPEAPPFVNVVTFVGGLFVGIAGIVSFAATFMIED